jgi:cyclic pyranopterin phosphate synthase
VTDRCNLKCVYCHPLPDCNPIEHEEILDFEEILLTVRLFAECGIKKLRLTRGEPFLRRDIVRLVRELAAIASIDELSATTNCDSVQRSKSKSRSSANSAMGDV